ncbi:MAG TPA: TonB-dependent receptor [Dinghuibacter sp.]|uniref:SusC/RagA family TonB-linked outer membrane protein n=1 Tax=Dinghuibacter sp. TaxID=2024697 RepID=UPI002CE6F395|nr:TonB-dependent receptor [Dinghuibacter sp.]HTJ14018.1 TonB-dependent receptor [Dinghuibacter sp.]
MHMKKPRWAALLAVIALYLAPQLLRAQSKNVSGVVTDEAGKPIPYVSVLIKGKTSGAQTDETGHFTISVPRGAILVFSSINYETIEQTAGDGVLTVTLKAKGAGMSDVVIVGYGTQKKVDLTGSVSTVSSKELDNRPVTNVSSSLAGLASGVYVHQTSGQPGSDGASINIRGVGTLSSTSALVVVDGIVSSMDAVNPSDIESISILKDAASAAIYGAQAANGVILITTRKGARSRPTVSYSGLFSQTNPTGLPKFVTNSARYMQLLNEAYSNVGVAKVFDSATVIQPFIDAEKNPNGLTSLGVPNYVAYPNTNWEKVLFQHKLLQNHNVSVSGGGDNTTYLLSLGYLNNPGLITNSGIEKYQFRANFEARIGKNITVGTQTYGYTQHTGMADLGDLFNYLVQTSPMIYPYYKGMYGSTSAAGDVIGNASNLLNFTQANNGGQQTTFVSTTWYGKVNIIKGLTFEPRVNYGANFYEEQYSTNPVVQERWNFLTMQEVTAPPPASQLSTTNYFSKWWNYTLESVLRYNTTLAGVHNIGALAGYNEYYYNSYFNSETGLGLIDPTITAIGTATTFPTNPTGSATNWATRSWFGRVNYNYKDKYLLEGNLRYDGSSRFGPNQRWGTFPSVSAGWNIMEEPFMAGLKDRNIQSIKLRGSYGTLGNTISVVNGSTNNYLWQATYGVVDYSFNGLASNGLRQGQIANNNLQWETTGVTDIGVDLVALRNLTATAEYYRRFTHGILFQPPLDPTVGTASAPVENLAQVLNSGIELQLGWHGNIDKFSYAVSGNVGYNYLNRVVRYKGPLVQSLTTDASGNKTFNSNISAVSAGGNNRILEGHPINEYYLQTVYKGTGKYFNADGSVDPKGGPKTGMIRTTQDLQWVQAMIAAGYKFPVNTVGPSQFYYGDLIYADNDGDGTYGTANDQQFQNVTTTPKVVYGFTLSAAWKGIDFNMIWAGAAGMKYYWNQTYYNSSSIALGGTIPERIADNHYSATNPDGYFPRVKSSDGINNIASTFWLYDASYLRLKNLQVGYTFPERLLRGAGNYVSRIRVFVSGENLLTFTKYPGPDPETGSSVTYPTMKQYAFGINATF